MHETLDSESLDKGVSGSWGLWMHGLWMHCLWMLGSLGAEASECTEFLVERRLDAQLSCRTGHWMQSL
jgi:hypothetical protein